MRGVTGSLQGVSSEGEGDGRPSRGAGVWKEEQRISLKVQRGCRTWASALRKTGGVKNRAPLAVSLGAVARCRWLRNHRQGRGAG